MTSQSIARGPRHVLLRYLSVSLISRAAMCCGILIALMEILALLEQMTPILRRHLGLAGVLTYMALHLPAMMQTALPLSVLIGMLLMLTQMTVNSEVAILRASGLSPVGFLRLLIPATLAIGLFGIVLEDQITPRTELALASWWNRSDPHPEDGHAFWFHVPRGQASTCGMAATSPAPTASELAHIGYVTHAGHDAYEIDLYDRDASGRLLRTLHADHAHHSEQGWTLHDIRCISVSFASLDATADDDTSPEARWINPFGPTDMLRLSLDSSPLSSNLILKALHGRAATNLTPGYLRATLFERFLRPLSLIVMLLLAMSVIYIPPRTGLRSWLPVWCLGAGLLFIIVQGMFRAMGNAGLLPAPVATVPGLIIFTLAAGTALLRNEDK
ncbi:LptF/LptG family permease [Acetobacter fallax]|uniref:LptF/LptG family permease n=1 Tax=Acetobacter fallax TaxID=1737473 RepID=A0ABX0K903_9PROT|nr:LptF/LptG family permease [Acetobacter fallax]NHO32905.1 LptF/LptG family permease [Acetobacter fallax]NHO36467.1 LptF/LptG family permease [Acetobacter fallax]